MFVCDDASKGLISKGMLNFAGKISKESIIEVKARVAKTTQEVASCT